MRGSYPQDGPRERQAKKGIYYEIICEVDFIVIK